MYNASKTGLFHIHGLLADKNNFGVLEKNKELSELVTQESLSFWDACSQSKNQGSLELLHDISRSMVDEIIIALEEKDFSQVILHGNSLGGKVAVNIACDARLEGRLGGVVLNCAACLGEDLSRRGSQIFTLMSAITTLKTLAEQKNKMKEIVSLFVDFPIDNVPDELVHQTLDLAFLKNASDSRYSSRKNEQLLNFMKLGALFKKGDIHDSMIQETRQQLQQLKERGISSLVIAGKKDTILPLDIAQQQAELLGVDLHVLDTGHVPHIEDTKGFVDLLSHRLKSV